LKIKHGLNFSKFYEACGLLVLIPRMDVANLRFFAPPGSSQARYRVMAILLGKKIIGSIQSAQSF